MSTGKPRDPRKEQLWRRLVAQFGKSGLSVRAFCQLHDLSEPSFYSWRGKLRKRDAEALRLVPVTLIREDYAVHAPVVTAPALELVLSDGRLVRVGTDFDGPTLQRLLALLEEGRP